MSARFLVFSVVVIAAGVLALILVTSRGSAPSRNHSSGQSAGRSERGPAEADRSAPRRPTPSGRSSQIPTGPPRERPQLKTTDQPSDPGFAAEERDEAWAASQEREIRDRAEGLLEEIRGADRKAVDVARIECKSTRCRLRVSGGDSKRFMRFVEALQGTEGFYGSAEQLMLQGYSSAEEPGARSSVTVMLVYDRKNE